MDPEVLTVFTGAAGDLQTAILIIAPVALGVGVLTLVIRKGWKTVKQFSN